MNNGQSVVKDLRLFMRRLRLENGELTLQQMAEMLNVSQSYLSQIENGRRDMSQNFISTLTNVFELDNEQSGKIITYSKNLKKQISIPLQELSDVKKKTTLAYVDAMENLDDAEFQKIYEMIRNKKR